MIGMMAISKSGHDKDRVYVILDEDEEYVYLSDGHIRTVDHAKKKKKKHIQLVKQTVPSELFKKICSKDARNEEIKCALDGWKGAN